MSRRPTRMLSELVEMLREAVSSALPLLLLASMLALQGCAKSNRDSASIPGAAPQTNATPKSSPLTEFERDLQYVRNGQYSYVWVFSRKDGKSLDKDDAAYLRKYATQVVDWIGTDGGKQFIAGTNFDLEQGNLNLLKKRFVVEDYSGK